ncbi:flagellar hook-length control protein FliK [Vreelandella boliviensis]|uniref:Flagellar hook-length control protein n=1 Tax=Vreelandella boliviensis LC1 TaxID=1072583 RepID=A0A265DYU3_9GAMM|nr:flagellar hook-length control protein FliK [Halomonas boliviensis]EHJ94155.1 Flagellar hook-length control protein [Halomonas boliviensis LC1]OZT74455.1 flagellar hook-length control protein FliK [Halomonas boliviensis LC1]
MNIHQLLSVSQGSPQTQSQGAFSRQDSANGLFHQTLLHASDTHRLSAPMPSETSAHQAPLQQTQLDTLATLLSDALEADVENLSALLETLGLDVSESDLSALLAQLQQPNSAISVDTLRLNSGEASTSLDEIAGRLALMASFSESSPEAELESSIAPAVLEAVAKQLNINQTEAAQLVSALNVLVGQQQSTNPLPAEAAQLANARSPVVELQAAPRPQSDTLFAQINTGSAVSQISSEALMGALMTVEGAPKGAPASEHLLSGFSLSSSGPPPSSPSAQGFTPAVNPTAATLTTPVTNPAWPQQLSQQLVQISQRGGEQHVQMQLNPAELGPLSISLKFGEQGAQAHFLSAHAQVRQVLEQAIPQLREALAEQGISLGETSVGEQRDPNAQGFAQSSGQQGTEAGGDGGDIGLDEATQSAGSSPLILDGRVDLYA